MGYHGNNGILNTPQETMVDADVVHETLCSLVDIQKTIEHGHL